jgi:hypothetical protein
VPDKRGLIFAMSRQNPIRRLFMFKNVLTKSAALILGLIMVPKNVLILQGLATTTSKTVKTKLPGSRAVNEKAVLNGLLENVKAGQFEIYSNNRLDLLEHDHSSHG